MRKVELRMNEMKKYLEIKNLVDHGGNKERIALKLGITVRQVNRLIIIYKEWIYVKFLDTKLNLLQLTYLTILRQSFFHVQY